MSEIEKASDHFFQGYCDKDKYCDDVDGSFQQPFVMEYEIDEFISVLRLTRDRSGLFRTFLTTIMTSSRFFNDTCINHLHTAEDDFPIM